MELIVMGGAVMTTIFDARQSTRDVDVLILSPPEAGTVRDLARVVGEERGWPAEWLNDAAKGYMVGISRGERVLSAPGIEAWAPAAPQLLAMKLSSWRDDVDVADARRLLEACRPIGDRDTVWRAVAPFLVPGDELKAEYAFGDLWENVYGDNTGAG